MNLKTVLQKYAPLLRNVRAFYIVEALMDKGTVVKFGIAGMSSGNAYHRLEQYNITYGAESKDNTCRGVLVHYIGITEYNRLVKMENTQIYQLEKFLKKEYNSQTEPGRGSERVSKVHLQSILRTIRTKRFQDVQTKLRDTNRETTKKFQKDQQAFIDSRVHKTRQQTKKN